MESKHIRSKHYQRTSSWQASQKKMLSFALILRLLKAIINGIKCLFTCQVVIPEVTHKESYVEDSEPFNFQCSKMSRSRLLKSYFPVSDLILF